MTRSYDLAADARAPKHVSLRSVSLRRMRLVTLVGAASLAAASSPVMAQSGAEDGQELGDQGLGDIVVTATRNSESLSKVAASISAVTADDLGAGGIKDVASLASAIPNLSVGDQFGVNRIFIRGIGLTSIDLSADGGANT